MRTTARLARPLLLSPLLLACLAAGLPSGLPAQQVTQPAAPLQVTTADGNRLDVESMALPAGGRVATFRTTGSDGGGATARVDGDVKLPLEQVLGVQGPAPDLDANPHGVRLADGGELRGRVVGGDDYGDAITLECPAFGTLQVPLDAIQSVGFAPGAVGDWSASDDGDDVLYVAARLGVDSILGAIHRVDAEGVWFARLGRDEPEHFPFRRVVGLGIAFVAPRAVAPKALLVTRYGDRIAVPNLEIADGRLSATALLDLRLEMDMAQLAALTPLGPDRVHLSDLPPRRVEEHSYEDPEHPLYPHRMDCNVLGAPLVAMGRCHGKGIGVHAMSRMAWEVPPRSQRFVTWVAIDDSSLALLPRAEVQVQVRLGGEPAAEPIRLAAGDAPQRIGPFDVRPGQTLELEVDFGRGLDLADRVLWLHPTLLR